MIDEYHHAVSALSGFGITHNEIKTLDIGLINSTYLVINSDSKFILQHVNSMFPDSIHEDINAVTCHLHDKNISCPRLIRTVEDGLFLNRDGQTWRMFNYIDGISFNTVDDPAVAWEAGTLLAEFHEALQDLDYEFRSVRPGVHDTQKHLTALENALNIHQDHVNYREILKLGNEILDFATRLPILTPCPERTVHGDPKINNILFDKNSQRGICLIDFDTLGKMPLVLELGDALRSWCNPGGEDIDKTTFSIDTFKNALQGYASISHEYIIEEEWRSLVDATHIIYLELAARFCADALNESFFSWDPNKFESHSQHNQIRARGQLNALKSLVSQSNDANKILNAVFT